MANDVSSFEIHGEGGDYLKIKVYSRAHPKAVDYWDGNWLNAEVEVKAGLFRGKYRAFFRTTDFSDFRNQLDRAFNELREGASFETMEEQLIVRVKGDGIGHFVAECRAQDEAGIGNVLEFTLTFDQTDIPPMLRDLDSISAAFPIVGSAERG